MNRYESFFCPVKICISYSVFNLCLCVQYVDENYAGELQEAILQSKLEYEQNKVLYDRIRKENELEKKLAAGGKKKKKAMTLEEFKNFQVTLSFCVHGVLPYFYLYSKI